MMTVWIVWSTQPLAVFSSEQRARTFITQHRAENVWHCAAASINPEAAADSAFVVPALPGKQRLSARH